MSKGCIIFIGLGLFDEKDISLKGLEEINNCDEVFAEFYTARLFGTNKTLIEKKIGKKINILSRRETENGDLIIKTAIKKNVAFLSCGDTMTATTHIDLRLKALRNGIDTKIIHGSSIMTAVPGLLGLQNYKFGRTTTLVFPEKNYFPISPYDVINENMKMGLHSLVLLDIQDDKKSYMTANEGIELLIEMEKKRKEQIINDDTLVCVVARAGSIKPTISAGRLINLKNKDFGPPLHTLVFPGKIHFIEKEALEIIANFSNKSR